jgi:hypothetical protein
MRKFIALILILVFSALLLPQTGRAQNEIVLQTLEVNLWPEYDQPEMLVFYLVTLQPGIVPATLTFRIPKAAGKPYNVAVRAEDGMPYRTDYRYGVGSEWGEVTFTANTPNFQIEYYDPRLVKQGKDRSFDYTWSGDYAVLSAAIVVQRPFDASQMQFTPEAGNSFTGVDGLLYYSLQIGTLQKDQAFDFSLSYQKPSDVLTYPKRQVHPAGALPQSMWIRGLPWAFGVLAVLVIMGGVWFYWRSGQPQAGEKLRRRKKSAAQASVETTDEEGGVYCHNCGRRAALSDVFCRSCGTKLRI